MPPFCDSRICTNISTHLRRNPNNSNMAKKISILLVEDDDMLRTMYSEKFTKAGFDIKTAEDGKLALTVLKNVSPDLILLDIVMPNMDGFELLKVLRKEKKYAKVPIIMLTNMGAVDDIRKCERLGANDYFVKANHTPSEVLAKVQTFLTEE